MTDSKLTARSNTLEVTILASLLGKNAQTLAGVCQTEIAHPAAFYDHNRRAIYIVLCDLHREGQELNLSTLGDRLAKTRAMNLQQRCKMADSARDAEGDRLTSRAMRAGGDDEVAGEYDALAMVGGFTALIDLVAQHVTDAGFREACRSLWSLYIRRSLATDLDRQTGDLRRGIGELDTYIEKAQATLIRAQNRISNETTHSMAELVPQAQELAQKVATGEVSPGVKTGVAMLDAALTCLRPGSFNIIAARPGVGKTTFALYLLSEIMRTQEDARALFISLEVQSVPIVYKLAARVSGADFRDIEEGQVTDKYRKAVSDAYDEISNWPCHIDYGASMNIDQIRAKAIRYKAEYPDLSVLFVDYIQIVQGTRSYMTDYEKVTEVSNGLDNLSATLGIPVVGLSQLRRDDDKKNRPPSLTDLRGSGSLEQDADTVLFLHKTGGNAEDTEREIQVRIAKNRFGPQLDLAADFCPQNGRYEVHGPNRKKHEDADQKPKVGGHYDNQPHWADTDTEDGYGPSWS